MTCDDIKECCRSSENKKRQDWWKSRSKNAASEL